jgi:hypothetical protein
MSPESPPEPKRRKRRKKRRPVIGWREWVGLPELGVERVKAKIDTGARSSALHAFNLRVEQRDAVWVVSFDVHPIQRDWDCTVPVEHPLDGFRRVRSSNGKSELRPVIRTSLQVMGVEFPIDLTLTRRDVMGFRLLLGREAIRKRFLVDAGRSFFSGKEA